LFDGFPDTIFFYEEKKEEEEEEEGQPDHDRNDRPTYLKRTSRISGGRSEAKESITPYNVITDSGRSNAVRAGSPRRAVSFGRPFVVAHVVIVIATIIVTFYSSDLK